MVGLVKNELARIAARWRVGPDDDLDRATAELINTSSMDDSTPSLLTVMLCIYSYVPRQSADV